MKLRGFRTLERKFRKLPRSVQREALGQATDVGARLLRNAARQKAPQRTGRLQRAIGFERKSTAKVRAVSRAGVKKDAFYAHMVEYGTGARETKRRANFEQRPSHYWNKARGSLPARPFMRPAWDANKERIVSVMSEVLKRRIERVAR